MILERLERAATVRWLGRISVVLLCAAALAAGFAGVCALSYWNDMRIDPRRGVSEAGYVRIGDIDQWVQIRGRDRRNPVLLWLNGGPGFSTIGDTYWVRDWERRYTVVMWDQRGEGRTFDRSGTTVKATMSIAQLTRDGNELADYLRRRLHKDRIILLGHSWGSMLGVLMVQARPDMFSAYVGTGQLVSEQADAVASYPQLLARARVLGVRRAEQELLAAGPPPYPSDVRRWIPWALWAQALDPPARDAPLPSPGELWLAIGRLWRPRGPTSMITPAVQFSMVSLWPEIVKEDLRSQAFRFRVPVVFVQGADDITTMTTVAKDYFDEIDAPAKSFVVIPDAGHLALFRARAEFLHALDEYVRPLTER